MRRLAGGRLGAVVSLSLVLATGLSSGTAAGASPSTRAPSAESAKDAGRTVELPRPAHGATAIRLLGDQLEDAATLNDVTGARLLDLLRSDPSAWLDRDGWVFFKDEAAVAPAVDPVTTEAPLDQTFLLHSNPGSPHTIFLDFDGGTASATAWHQDAPTVPVTQPPWDPSGNGAEFDAAELAKIQTVWQAVAEDYAPFDIDVTTADPGAAAIHRATAADTTFGSHVLITPSVDAQQAICPGGCGGVAYLSVFGGVGSAGGDGYGFHQPAWVFPHQLGQSAKNIAEAVSHEAGHNLGLMHDGNATQGYDAGHGAWAPIMGVGYLHPITQWSKGNYAGADNAEDDVAIIRAVAGERADEAGTSIVSAPAVPADTAYVTTRTDIDTYWLGTCTGSVTVNASALAVFADLDIVVSLLDAAGQVVASADPASAQTSASVASGMSASLTRTLAPGTYYASIDGVGNGSWTAGYDDYGSLGAYTLAVTGCTDAPPATTTSLTATPDGRSVSLTAIVSATPGTPQGTVQLRDGPTALGSPVTLVAGAASWEVNDLPRGTHRFTAEFVPSDTSAYAPSRSIESVVEIAATPTATSLTASVSGATVTLQTAVSPPVAGTVELREGATLVGAVTVATGAGQLTLSDVASGDHTYAATFVPTDAASFAGSSSPPRTVTVAEVVVPATTPPPSTPPAATPPTTTTPPPTTVPPTTVPPAALATSATKVVAPKKAKEGSRPAIVVTVRRGTAAASGKVVVTVGKKKTTLSLVAGKARLKLPKMRKGKLKITVRYLGNATTAASSATWTIKV